MKIYSLIVNSLRDCHAPCVFGVHSSVVHHAPREGGCHAPCVWVVVVPVGSPVGSPRGCPVWVSSRSITLYSGFSLPLPRVRGLGSMAGVQQGLCRPDAPHAVTVAPQSLPDAGGQTAPHGSVPDHDPLLLGGLATNTPPTGADVHDLPSQTAPRSKPRRPSAQPSATCKLQTPANCKNTVWAMAFRKKKQKW